MSLRYKVSHVRGIHAHEKINLRLEEAGVFWEEITTSPDTVFAALYKSGHEAPLSGTSYHLISIHLQKELRDAVKAEAYTEVAKSIRSQMGEIEGRPDDGLYEFLSKMCKGMMRTAAKLRKPKR